MSTLRGFRVLTVVLVLALTALAGCAGTPAQSSPAAAPSAAAPPAGAGSAAESAALAAAEPTASGFVLGEGDLVRLTMFGQPDMETTAYVSAQGKLSLPLIGAIDVGGMTPTEAGDRVSAAYRNGGYFLNPQVNLTVEQYRSRQISVLGEVNQPGRYPLETHTTVLDALAMAGGVMPSGARTVTVLRRSGTETKRLSVDMDQVVGSGYGGIALIAGDVLYVPEAQKFYIYGEVQRPDAYPLKPGMTVMQAISVGGGVTERGSSSRVEIRRRDASGKLRTYGPDLNDPVQADDVIYVKERFF